MCRLYIILLFSLIACLAIQAQVSFSLHLNKSSIIAKPFEQEVDFYHETMHQVTDQKGEWNFELSELILATAATLNEQGQYASTVVFFGGNGDFFTSADFTYNAAGQLEQISEKFRYTKAPVLINYSWPQKGKVPTSVNLERFDKPVQSNTFQNIRRNSWKENILLVEKGEQIIVEWKDERPTVYNFYDKDGNFQKRQVFEYNEEGLVNKITLYGADNTTVDNQTDISYLYDEHGNWIKRLQHDRRSGKYLLSQRQIGYRSKLTESEQHAPIAGIWHGINKPLILMADEGGSFSFFELQEEVITTGTWTENGWGQAELKMGKSNRIRMMNRFQQGWTFTAELAAGRLLLHRDDDHYEFVADWFAPQTAEVIAALHHERWKETRFDKPGHRNPEIVPVGLREGFANILPIAANRFVACVSDTLCGIVDETGYPLIPFAYDYLSYSFPGHYVVNRGRMRGLIDTLGQEVLPVEYDAIWAERLFGTSVFGTRKNSQRYYYDVNTQAFWPYEKEDMRAFNDNRFIVREDRDWILTDRNFEPIKPDLVFRGLSILSADRYLANDRIGSYQIINAEGEEMASLTGFLRVSKAVYGYLTAKAKDNDLYALLDYDGNQLTEAVYEDLQFCTSKKQQEEFCYELLNIPALAKYRKPNGEEGYLTGLGKEVSE